MRFIVSVSQLCSGPLRTPQPFAVALCFAVRRFLRLRFDPVHGGEMAVEESTDILSLAAAETLRASALPARCQGEAVRGAVGQVHAS